MAAAALTAAGAALVAWTLRAPPTASAPPPAAKGVDTFVPASAPPLVERPVASRPPVARIDTTSRARRITAPPPPPEPEPEPEPQAAPEPKPEPPAAAVTPPPAPKPPPAGPCDSLKGLRKELCAKCGNTTGIRRAFCEGAATSLYCAERRGADPDCPEEPRPVDPA